MGNSLTTLFSNLAISMGLKNKEARVLLIGLDAAGKTSILYRMKLGEVVTTIPTIGFNVETINYKNISFTAWDVGGRDKIRPLYRHYYVNTQALIFVIDSNDRERIKDARETLDSMIREDELRDSILVVLANKQDLENAMSVDEVKKEIGFDDIRVRAKTVIGTCAITGQGLYEAFEWMSNVLSQPIGVEPVLETIEDTKTMVKSVQTNFGSISYLFKYLTKSA